MIPTHIQATQAEMKKSNGGGREEGLAAQLNEWPHLKRKTDSEGKAKIVLSYVLHKSTGYSKYTYLKEEK